MQYFDIYIDRPREYTLIQIKMMNLEIGDNVIVPFRNIKKTGFIIRKLKRKLWLQSIEYFIQGKKIFKIIRRTNKAYRMDK